MTAEEVKIGARVIANKFANGKYSITREGWVGTIAEYSGSEIKVRGSDLGHDTYWVEFKCFDLVIDEADKDTFLNILIP